MKREQAIRAVWDLLNKNDYSGAAQLYKTQSRKHGRRVFGCRIRLNIANGIWLEENNLV